MPTRLPDLYRDMTQLLGKYRAYLTPAEFVDALYFASRGLFDFYSGKPEQYRTGRPVPPVAYQVTQAVSDALHPFLREVSYGRDEGQIALGTMRRLESSGRFTLPPDWVHPTVFDVPGATEAVQVLDDNEVRGMLGSLICPPTLECPMLGLVPNGYQLYPAEADALSVQYLSLPRRPVFAFDYPPDGGEPVYNDADSVDVEWPASRDNQLLTRLLQYPALGLRDGVVQQVAATLSERGT